LTDKEYQRMRDASIAVLRKIGVDTGGSNVQFAVNPADGRLIVIEINPRVSRSALASKATGFPIAKVAAKLAVGYTLDELRNDITGGATAGVVRTASIDYVVTKVPRFTFEKFKGATIGLTTRNGVAVGEVMAIGLHAARITAKSVARARDGSRWFDARSPRCLPLADDAVARLRAARPSTPAPIGCCTSPMRSAPVAVVRSHSTHWCRIHPWFLAQLQDLIVEETAVSEGRIRSARCGAIARAEAQAFSDAGVVRAS
jgi:carbamoyl-phosphate synthase large subunit